MDAGKLGTEINKGTGAGPDDSSPTPLLWFYWLDGTGWVVSSDVTVSLYTSRVVALSAEELENISNLVFSQGMSAGEPRLPN